MSEAIRQFLKPLSEGGAYTDERLAMLLAPAEDGKLAFQSCCCLARIPTATHVLQGVHGGGVYPDLHFEYPEGGEQVSYAFAKFGDSDSERRAKLIPMIKDEMARREALRSEQSAAEFVAVIV
jgi:hypothetical protein